MAHGLLIIIVCITLDFPIQTEAWRFKSIRSREIGAAYLVGGMVKASSFSSGES